jgi:hypothetical protein
MAEKPPKRPRDVNQWAKHMVDLATGAVPEPGPPAEPKSPAAVAAGKLGGAKGGPARAKKLTPRQRSMAARKAAKARWGH